LRPAFAPGFSLKIHRMFDLLSTLFLTVG